MKPEMDSNKLIYVQWHNFNLTNHNNYIDYKLNEIDKIKLEEKKIELNMKLSRSYNNLNHSQLNNLLNVLSQKNISKEEEKIVKKEKNDILDYYDIISQKEKKLLSNDELKNLQLRGLNEYELSLMKKYKLYELKDIAKKNYIDIKKIKGNKSDKRTWVKAISKIPNNWGLNTFIVGTKNDKKNVLNSQVDILLMIQDFV
tara:strand:- start:68 stop:667 length:600 start_codon:yes stop_codon:yes gene_type:complete